MTVVPPQSGSQLRDRLKPILKAASVITKERLAAERRLGTMKWFDYRWLSPYEATELFADTCLRVYSETWGPWWKSAGSETADGLPLAGELFTPEEFAFLWRARQHADALGMPYRLFVQTVYKISKRRRGKYRPNRGELLTLHWTPALCRGLRDHWYFRRRSWITLSELPHYRSEAFRGLPPQIAHWQWVLDQIELCGTQSYHIAQYVFRDGVLPIEMAVARFGKAAVDRARIEFKHLPTAPEEVAESSLLPACFLVPHAVDLSTSPCSSCPLASRCSAGEQVARKALVHMYGTDDPGGRRLRTVGTEHPDGTDGSLVAEAA